MAIRTAEDLVEKVSAQLAWRRKEITALKFLIQSKNMPFETKPILIRSAIPIYYAHWEGFVKVCSTNYLEYVTMQRERLGSLKECFVALSVKSKLKAASSTNDLSSFSEIIKTVLNNLNNSLHIPFKSVINTQSNLNSDVLQDILEVIGLDYSPYETKAHIIDELLLAKRNHIAHGQETFLDEDSAIFLGDETMWLLQTFRDQVENAAALRSHLK